MIRLMFILALGVFLASNGGISQEKLADQVTFYVIVTDILRAQRNSL